MTCRKNNQPTNIIELCSRCIHIYLTNVYINLIRFFYKLFSLSWHLNSVFLHTGFCLQISIYLPLTYCWDLLIIYAVSYISPVINSKDFFISSDVSSRSKTFNRSSFPLWSYATKSHAPCYPPPGYSRIPPIFTSLPSLLI